MYNCKRNEKIYDLANDENKKCSVNSIRSTCGAWRYLDGAWVPAPAVCKSNHLFLIKEETQTYSSEKSISVNFSVLEITDQENHITGDGVTFSSFSGNTLSYRAIADYSGTPINMKIFVGSEQRALITFTTSFLGQEFEFVDNGVEHKGVFTGSGSFHL